MADPTMTSAIAQMMTAGGITMADLESALAGTTDHLTDLPTVADYAEKCLLALQSPASRRSYRTHLNRLCNGVGPVCSCMCEACAVGYINDGDCAWSCKACNENPLSFTAVGHRAMRDDTFSYSDLETFVTLAERLAAKRAIRDNVSRRAKGLGPLATHGQAGRSTCVNALSRLFRTGRLDQRITWNPAEELRSGKVVDTKRRALTDTEIVELFDVVVSGGDDPQLDFLLCWASLELGNRRGGLLGLTMADLNMTEQLVTLHEKGTKERQQPASKELLEALTAHAISRAGARCDATSGDFDGTAPVLYYSRSTPQTPRPLARKRFETLHKRIQLALPWANEMGFSLHCARHTAGTLVERIAGTQVARKFLGHGSRKVTDRYTNATSTELATAFSAMTGRSHPAADNIVNQGATGGPISLNSPT